jgi:hypothetical protein
MKNPQVKNVVASVLAKLRNTSKSSGVAFQQYAMERIWPLVIERNRVHSRPEERSLSLGGDE